jgi:hydrogenase-4 component B
MGLGLIGAIALTSYTFRNLLMRQAISAGPTWGCGYAAPSARMQYTSSSFAQLLVALFAWALRPKRRQPANLTLFPKASEFHSDVPDAVLEEGILPALRGGAWLFGWARVFQQGSIQMYLLYIILTLLVLLVWR